MDYELILPVGYLPKPLPGRDIWVAALRSGTYKQGSGMLTHKDCDCCLGVLCKLQGRPSAPYASDDHTGIEDSVSYDGDNTCLGDANPLQPFLDDTGMLPSEVSVRMPDTEEERGFSIYYTLTECNDNGLTFAQIADIIEAVWTNAPANWNPPC